MIFNKNHPLMYQMKFIPKSIECIKRQVTIVCAKKFTVCKIFLKVKKHEFYIVTQFNCRGCNYLIYVPFAIKRIPQIASTWIIKCVWIYLLTMTKKRGEEKWCDTVVIQNSVLLLLLYISFQGKVVMFYISWHCGITESLKNLIKHVVVCYFFTKQ